MVVSFNDTAVDSLASDVDAAIGEVRVNYDIEVEDGVASVTEGHDGEMVDRDVFAAELSEAFLNDGEDGYSVIVAHTTYAPLQIDKDEATRVCELVNAAICYGAEFEYGSATWVASATDVGAWVATRVVENKGEYSLEAYLDEDTAKGIIANNLNVQISGTDIVVSFEIRNGERVVHAETEETIPAAGAALEDLEDIYFGSNSSGALDAAPVITVESTSVPDSISFEEALEYGIICAISSYTTEYTSDPSERQHNIHLAADLLNNSIVSANGGTWSFNDITGDYDEEAGFQSAGAISAGEYVTSVGGGVCQVATTVFNAVYDSGFPVLERHNHSLYIASYPAGRDAAVAYDTLDLRWENDSASDVLLDMSYTDTSVTATIYGVSPEYQVSTQVGEWEEGDEYSTTTTVDDTLSVGESYVKTVGTNGRKISLVRTVTDKDGTILHQDTFASVYKPVNEVIVTGPSS